MPRIRYEEDLISVFIHDSGTTRVRMLIVNQFRAPADTARRQISILDIGRTGLEPGIFTRFEQPFFTGLAFKCHFGRIANPDFPYVKCGRCPCCIRDGQQNCEHTLLGIGKGRVLFG